MQGRSSAQLVVAATRSLSSVQSKPPQRTKSYAHGASNRPLLHDTVGDRLRYAVESQPTRPAFVFAESRLMKTYDQFYADAHRLASSLLALGLEKGDRVGVWGPNHYEWVCTQFATALAGLVQVNVNPAYKADELRYALSKVGCRALLTPRSFRKSQYYDTLLKVLPELERGKPGFGARVGNHSSALLPQLEHIILFGERDKLPGVWDYADVLKAGNSTSDRRLAEITDRIRVDDPVNVQYTSGTTGHPKAATLTHHNIVNNAYFLGLASTQDKSHRVLCVPNPLYHCFGCVMGTLNAVVHHNTVVFPATGFDAAAALRACSDFGATDLFGTPTMFVDMLTERSRPGTNYDLSTLYAGYIAGAPCPPALCTRMVKELGMRDMTICYGSTELSPMVSMSRLEDEPLRRIMSVGYPSDHVELCVVDDTGKVLPIGEKGELLARGYMTMLGYWGDEERTRKEIGPDRWYRTGDLATMTETGEISIVGRIKDLIIRGGENIYPTEIESFLQKLPYIADAHVVGVPDARLGEEICVWIRLKPDAEGKGISPDQIRDACKGQMAHYKIPRYIFLKSEADFPLTVTGKVKKDGIRELATAELGLGSVVAETAAGQVSPAKKVARAA